MYFDGYLIVEEALNINNLPHEKPNINLADIQQILYNNIKKYEPHNASASSSICIDLVYDSCQE